MTDLRKAAEMALEALEVATTPLAADRQEVLKAQQALRQALAQPEQTPTLFFGRAVYFADPKTGEKLAQPEQEPVAWWNGGNTEDESEDFMYSKTRQAHIDHPESFTHTFYPIPLYTAPPKRKWVGLTNEERVQAFVGAGLELAYLDYDVDMKISKVIESRLKEKNT